MATAQLNSRSLVKLLTECSAQVWVDRQYRGTAFFVAPSLVATCAHVVGTAAQDPGRITIRWNTENYAVGHSWCEPYSIDNPDPYPYPDIALLDVPVKDHPWVSCEDAEPTLYPEPDRLYCVGWTTAFARDMPRLTPISLKYEGGLADNDEEDAWRLQLREGQISLGMSGAAVLNQRTGRVCAMMTRTRDQRADMGGWAVPIAKYFNRFSEVLDRISHPVSGRWTQCRQTDLFRGFTTIIRPAHRPLPAREDLPPSLLLRTEYAVVPFVGRQDEINGLTNWCASGEQSAARLLIGPAGAGKTRLAAQLCSEMSSRGWTTGFLLQGCKPESFDELRETGSPLLAVLDYGDAWLELEKFLIRLEAPAETAPPTRIVLLARHGGDWWNRLITTNPYVKMDDMYVSPATASKEDLTAIYLNSADEFCRRLNVPSLNPKQDIPALTGQPILVVHMAALLQIDPSANEAWKTKGSATRSRGSTIVESILSHEEGYWERSVAAAGIGASNVVLRRVVALAALFGWEDEMDLANLLTAVPDLADASSERRHALARWVMTFYAVHDPSQQEILQPDLLAERLIGLALVDCPQLLLTALKFIPPERGDHAFAIIDRACHENNHLRWMLEKIVRTNLGQLGPMLLRVGERSRGPLREELMRAVRTVETDLQTLEYLLDRIPANSVMLKDVAITICQRAVEMARRHGDPMVEAAMLERMASQLATAGHKNEAADLSVEALGLIIRHSEGNESTITTALFEQFLKTSQRLRAIRRTADSVDLLLRARDLALEAMPTDPAFYMSQLARALANLTTAYRALGWGADMAASVQAEWEVLASLEGIDNLTAKARLAGQLESRVSVLQDYIPRTEIIRAVSEAHQVRLAAAAISEEPLVAEIHAWRGLATVYDSLQCHDDAVAALENAELVWRRLAVSDLEAYGEGLAEVLMSRVNQSRSDNEHAIELLREVVSIRRSIVDSRPNKGSSAKLAQALLNLGDRLLPAGYLDDCIRATEEAVEIFRQLAEEHQGSELLRLAQVLDVFATRLIKAHIAPRAVMATIERLTIYRRLAAIDFGRYGQKLVIALMTSMHVLQAAGMRGRVASTAHEILKISERIQKRADYGDTDISKVYAGVGLALAKVGIYEDAISALRTSISLRRERASSDTFGEYAPELIRALGYLADVFSVMGRWREALAPADEAYAMCSQLLSELPRDRRHANRRSDTDQFYACLVRLNYLLERLSRHHIAARKQLEGLDILRLLAKNGNRAAMRLACRDLPQYRPLDALRAPWRAL